MVLPVGSWGPRAAHLLTVLLMTVLLMTVVGAAGACASGDGADAGHEPAPEINRASCEAPVGGYALSNTVVESAPGYDEALAGISTDALAATLSLGGLDVDQRSVLAYALELRLADLGEELDTAWVRSRGAMGEAVLAAFAAADTGGAAPMDFAFFRRGFHRYYACSRQHPATLADFEALHGRIADIPSFTIERSFPKAAPRRIREASDRDLFVAETLVGDAVRETEILLTANRDDGAIDFLVYGPDGALMDASEFATVTGAQVVSAVPYACMSCHVDHTTRAFNVVFPELQ